MKANVEALRALINEHPVDEFDRRTAAGEKLNLITGEYYRPVVIEEFTKLD